MAKIILITGGTRSGKSDFALQAAEKLAAPHCFIATCRVSDPEMTERVRKHQKERSKTIWKTVEEPVELTSVFARFTDYSCYLVDCLTLWISNLMETSQDNGRLCDEQFVLYEIDRLIELLAATDGTVIFVTNEVGMGIVPESQLARRYRDLVGFANRTIAARADEVILVSCGLPLYLKYLKTS